MPGTGPSPILSTKVPQATVERVDVLARERGITRSQIIRELLDQALASEAISA